MQTFLLDNVQCSSTEGLTATWTVPVDLFMHNIIIQDGLDDRDSRVRFPAEAGNFSLHHRVQNGSGAHPASYPMGTRGSFPGAKRPGREPDQECVELYLHSPSTSSWCGS
jgi:hypothetical protein